MKRKTPISHSTILRLPRYLHYLEVQKEKGRVRTSSTEMLCLTASPSPNEKHPVYAGCFSFGVRTGSGLKIKDSKSLEEFYIDIYTI